MGSSAFFMISRTLLRTLVERPIPHPYLSIRYPWKVIIWHNRLANKKPRYHYIWVCVVYIGDPDRTRTCNQLIKSQLLCQLSYGAVFAAGELYRITASCQRFLCSMCTPNLPAGGRHCRPKELVFWGGAVKPSHPKTPFTSDHIYLHTGLSCMAFPNPSTLKTGIRRVLQGASPDSSISIGPPT